MYTTARNIRAIDKAAFRADLESELALEACTADRYNAALRSVLDKHAPATRRKVPARKPSPWFGLVSEELLQAKRDRRHAETQWRATRLTVHKQIYQKAKQFVTSLIHKAKCLFYSTKIDEAQSSKELFHKMVCAPERKPLSSLLPTPPLVFPVSSPTTS